MTTGSLENIGHSRIVLGLFAVLAMSGCQNSTPYQSKVTSDAPKSSTAKSTEYASAWAIETNPVYIDLSPIDSTNLTVVPANTVSSIPIYAPHIPATVISPVATTPVSDFDRPIPATEAFTMQQLHSSIAAQQNPFDIEQPSGTLTDRCDPSYSGGIPPVNLRCGELITANPLQLDTRRAEPGVYVRLTPLSDPLLRNADLVVHERTESHRKLSDETLGAILIVETGRPRRPVLQPEPDLGDILAEEDVTPDVLEGTF